MTPIEYLHAVVERHQLGNDEELARLLQVHPHTLIAWRNWNVVPVTRIAKAIAKHLDIPSEWVIADFEQRRRELKQWRLSRQMNRALLRLALAWVCVAVTAAILSVSATPSQAAPVLDLHRSEHGVRTTHYAKYSLCARVVSYAPLRWYGATISLWPHRAPGSRGTRVIARYPDRVMRVAGTPGAAVERSRISRFNYLTFEAQHDPAGEI